MNVAIGSVVEPLLMDPRPPGDEVKPVKGALDEVGVGVVVVDVAGDLSAPISAA